jgi:nucleotide-binding universal stress UspA family protein
VDGTGPALIAYDGSDLAKSAIAMAGRLLRPGGNALVVTVWQPFDVGFIPAHDLAFDTAQVQQVKRAAEETAAEGASLAEAAGMKAQSTTVEGAPTWKALVDLADEHDSSVIVLGSHGRSGLESIIIGSVATAVASHSKRSVLIGH